MPPMDLSRDNAYDARLREIMRRNESYGLYANEPQPIMGGTRPRRMTSAGNTAYDSANFGTSGPEVAQISQHLMKMKRMKGGKWWHDVLEYIKPVSKPILEAATNRIVKTIGGERSGGMYGCGMDGQSGSVRRLGGVNRLKKAKRWLGFSKDAAQSGLDFGLKAFDAVKSRGGAKSGGVRSGGVRSGGKAPSPWIAHVKAYAAQHGCPYKQAMSLAKASYKR